MSDDQWWWDLRNGRAVQRGERPRDLDVLGPYPSKEAAEAWEETAKARNEEWKAEDERWEGDPSDGG